MDIYEKSWNKNIGFLWKVMIKKRQFYIYGCRTRSVDSIKKNALVITDKMVYQKL